MSFRLAVLHLFLKSQFMILSISEFQGKTLEASRDCILAWPVSPPSHHTLRELLHNPVYEFLFLTPFPLFPQQLLHGHPLPRMQAPVMWAILGIHTQKRRSECGGKKCLGSWYLDLGLQGKASPFLVAIAER